jgi:ubiquinone/menaquinone biosynthesis C-methylase UbiE
MGMTEQLLHGKLAKYYDRLYSYRDYLDEAVRIQNLIIKYSPKEPTTILDVACGTGLHLKHLKDDFSCTGVDISKDMLKIARKNAKGIVFKQADMKKLKLKKEFDVIICLLSSIGYSKTLGNFDKTIKNFYNHLTKGGLVLIEPSHEKSFYVSGKPNVTVYDGKDAKITRINISKSKPKTTLLTMHIVVAEKGKEAKYFVDNHKLGLFGIKETLKTMRNAGFKSKFLASGLMTERELLVGIKR